MEKIKLYLLKFVNKFKSMSRKKKLYFVLFFSFVFVLVWAFVAAGVITSNFNRSQISGHNDEQKVDAKGIIITETKQGKKYFEIYGETGHYSNDHSIATLNNVIGNFYKDGKVGMSFQSSKGTYDEKTGVITLYENTYIVLEDGVSLNTDKLIWSGSDKDTVAEGHVLIRKNKEMMTTAEKGIIGPGYEQFKIVGKTQTKVWSK